MGLIQGLMVLVCAGVLANQELSNEPPRSRGTISVNTSTSNYTDAKGSVVIPGKGFGHETVIGGRPGGPSKPLPGAGPGVSIVSVSNQKQNGTENNVVSSVHTVTKTPPTRRVPPKKKVPSRPVLHPPPLPPLPKWINLQP
ncbi:uncharacterized protein LOC108093030 [Drosophila ficusphila]|uniref:uncharacterized protein LOC108093030 n=1 Tax=Drosophila ficusphila TaxID=30025 RepID=UPI0007E7A07F|nr:uncharacterized protein LOC108093030 [Drosophila ficusphila]